MMSTLPVQGHDIISRRLKGGASVELTRPKEIGLYNSHMGGVDLSDQRMALATRMSKGTVWYKKLFFYILEVAVQNAYILNGKVGTLARFKLRLIRQLLQDTSRRDQRESTTDVLRLDSTVPHFLEQTDT